MKTTYQDGNIRAETARNSVLPERNGQAGVGGDVELGQSALLDCVTTAVECGGLRHGDIDTLLAT